MFDGGAKSQQVPSRKIIDLSFRSNPYPSLQYLHRNCAVRMVLLHSGCDFHRNQHSPEVLFLEECLRIETVLPWLLPLGIRHLANKVKLRQLADHIAAFIGT